MDEITMIALAVALKNREKRRQRKVWMETWLEKRPSHGYGELLRRLTTAPNDYRNFLRMDEQLFQQLVALVSPLIKKQDTNMRKAISPADRLAVTLRFLATGNSFEDMTFSSCIAATTISGIVEETCDALCSSLKDYIKMPRYPEEWKILAKDFGTRWNFPHCVGAIDGKHISIVKPANSGSFYYNYKGNFSVVLMAVVNANYEFIMADCGINGRISDGGVIGYTTFGGKLAEGTLGLQGKVAHY
ncbi:hypothetical protein RI129_003291 [Pyrocoelia pectoralis]|uniref:DDE Tnp4 domain-containing protein n=1 Tax=Pyrocoelia pectoralis TaxID=417401 RepID=A0AAN7VP34_9COLE